MIKVIIINGPGGVGKDTLVEYARKYLNDLEIPSMNISTVDKVKEAAKLLGWDGEKNDVGRKFLSDLKDLSSNIYNGPTNYILERIKTFYETEEVGVMFVHCREPEEIKRLVSILEDVDTVHVDRAVPRFDNHADTRTILYQYDHYINNNGTLSDLKEKTIELMRHILSV